MNRPLAQVTRQNVKTYTTMPTITMTVVASHFTRASRAR